MIGHFPILLYEDELFCSICARLNDHMRYPSIRGLREDLFGGKGVNRKAYLPSRLDHLVSMLPPGYRLSTDDIIDKHTILPFYSPFLPADRVNAIRMGMHTDKGQHTKRIGDTFRLPVFVRHLRYCPLCVEEERTKSECYWHRIHNVPGVEVCPMHCTWLEESDTDISRFVSADQAVRPGPARHLDRSNPYHASLLKIAQDALWLFNQGKPGADLRVIRWHYRFLLYKRELATYKGVIQADALLQSFASYFPAELLKHLNCEVNTARCWITRLVTACGQYNASDTIFTPDAFSWLHGGGLFRHLGGCYAFPGGRKSFLRECTLWGGTVALSQPRERPLSAARSAVLPCHV